MRIVSGGIQHETNTFADTPTTLADFERDSACGPEFAGGDTVLDLYRDTGTIHGGYIDAAEAADVQLLPLLCVRAQPAGLVTAETFHKLTNLFLERLQQTLPVDGVLPRFRPGNRRQPAGKGGQKGQTDTLRRRFLDAQCSGESPPAPPGRQGLVGRHDGISLDRVASPDVEPG